MKGKTLFLSTLSILVCLMVFLGSTYAWFSDQSNSGPNRIVAGNLDIGLMYKTGGMTDYQNAEDAATGYGENTSSPFFKSNQGTTIKWEPGVRAYTYFKVKNNGTLALQYTLETLVNNANQTRQGSSLKDVVKLIVMDGEVDLSTTNIDQLLEEKTLVDIEEFSKYGKLFPENLQGENLESEQIFTVIAYWKPTNQDDNYNLTNGKRATDGKSELYLDIEIKLFATQLSFEHDSFGNDYDKLSGTAFPIVISKEVMANPDYVTLPQNWEQTATADTTITINNVSGIPYEFGGKIGPYYKSNGDTDGALRVGIAQSFYNITPLYGVESISYTLENQVADAVLSTFTLWAGFIKDEMGNIDWFKVDTILDSGTYVFENYKPNYIKLEQHQNADGLIKFLRINQSGIQGKSPFATVDGLKLNRIDDNSWNVEAYDYSKETVDFNSVNQVLAQNYGGGVITQINENAFAPGDNNKYKLKSVVLNPEVTTIPDNAFDSNCGLNSINLENVVTIGNSAFEYCYALEDIDLSSAESVGIFAFNYNESLKNVKFSNSLKEIKRGAFGQKYGVEGKLTSIYIPKDCIIRDNVFDDHKNLTVYTDELEVLKNWSMGSSSDAFYKGTKFYYKNEWHLLDGNYQPTAQKITLASSATLDIQTVNNIDIYEISYRQSGSLTLNVTGDVDKVTIDFRSLSQGSDRQKGVKKLNITLNTPNAEVSLAHLHENMTINLQITSAKKVTIDGENSLLTGSLGGITVTNEQNSPVEIANLTISGDGIVFNAMADNYNFTVKNNTITNVGGDVITINANGNGAANLQITGNKIESWGKDKYWDPEYYFYEFAGALKLVNDKTLAPQHINAADRDSLGMQDNNKGYIASKLTTAQKEFYTAFLQNNTVASPVEYRNDYIGAFNFVINDVEVDNISM